MGIKSTLCQYVGVGSRVLGIRRCPVTPCIWSGAAQGSRSSHQMPGELVKTLKANPVFGFLGAVTVVAAALYGFNKYVDSRVENAVTDEAFLRKLSGRVRPYCILDAKGSVLVEGGAWAYIDKLKFDTSTNSELPQKVILTPKAFMQNAPLLTSLDDSSYYFMVERGQGIDWVYVMRYGDGSGWVALGADVDLSPPTWTNRTYRLRLEILP